MERDIKPHVTDLTQGRRLRLSNDDRFRLLRWASKTMMMYSQYDPGSSPFEARHFAALHAGGVPETMLMWLGRSESPFAMMAMSARPFWGTLLGDEHLLPGSRPNTATFYLAVQGVVFLANFSTFTSPRDMTPPTSITKTWIPLHGSAFRATWPRRLLTTADLASARDWLDTHLPGDSQDGLTPDEMAHRNAHQLIQHVADGKPYDFKHYQALVRERDAT